MYRKAKVPFKRYKRKKRFRKKKKKEFKERKKLTLTNYLLCLRTVQEKRHVIIILISSFRSIGTEFNPKKYLKTLPHTKKHCGEKTEALYSEDACTIL